MDADTVKTAAAAAANGAASEDNVITDAAAESQARKISIPDLSLLGKYQHKEAEDSRERVYMEQPEEFEPQAPSMSQTASARTLERPPVSVEIEETGGKDSNADSDSGPSTPDVLSPMTFVSVSQVTPSPQLNNHFMSLQQPPPPVIGSSGRSVSDMGPARSRIYTMPILSPDLHETPSGSFHKLNHKLRDLFHHQPKSPKNGVERVHSNDSEEADLFCLCAEGGHTQDAVRRVHRLLRDDKQRARVKGPGMKLALHRLCEAPKHTSYSVEICNALLKTNKRAAKTAVGGGAGGGHLPVHLLCLNDDPTEHSEAILRLVIHAYEDGVEKPGIVGARKVLPISMISEGRQLSPHSIKMFKRLLEVNKENVKLKAADGKTLLHRLCLSTRHLPHTECTVGVVQLILDVHRRAPEVPDGDGQRPLHILAQSEALTPHSVAIARMLLSGGEPVASLPDTQGQLALHHLCSSHKLTHNSQELCRLLLEFFEKGAQTQNREGRLPLHLVCASQKLSRHSVDVCRQLLLAHKQGFGQADCRGQLPVHVLCATMTEHRKGMSHAADILDQLMWTDKASVEAKDDQRRLPIHVLCASGLFSAHAASILGHLVKECPDAVSQPDQEGYLPLHLLLQSKPHTAHTVEGYRKLTTVLEADSRTGAQYKANADELPLHCLCGAGWHTKHSVQIFEWLLQQNPTEVDMVDATGMTPLHWLCSAWGHSEYSESIFNQLLELSKSKRHGAFTMAHDGVLPLHVLCGAGKHTENSLRIFGKLVSSHPGSLEVRTAREAAPQHGGGMKAKKWKHPVMQRQLSNTSSLFSVRNTSGLDNEEAAPRKEHELSETASMGTGQMAGELEPQKTEDVPVGRMPLHFLCGADDHTESSVAMCKQLLQLYPKAVTVQGEDGMIPLHLLCTARALTKHSVDVCSLVVAEYENITNDDELDLRPLLLVCQSQSLSAHSVQTCKLLLESQAAAGSEGVRGRKMARRSSMSSLTLKWLPLHDLCRSDMHTQYSAEICKQFLLERQDWASTPGDDGFLPLHCLCQAPTHTPSSVLIAQQLLDAHPNGVRHESSLDGCLPLHVLCRNTSRSEHSVKICELLLVGAAVQAARMPSASGLRPLHLLCSNPPHNDASVDMCKHLLKAYPQACSLPGNESDRDLPLHRLCRAEPHSEHSVQMCDLLVEALPRALWERGNAHYLDDEDFEDKHQGDDPLMTVCKGDMLNKHSSHMCPLLVTPDHQNLGPALHTLSQKVYRPKGNEDLQKMALRIVIRLSFVAGDVAVKYIDLDESNSGPHSLNFMKTVVDELGLDSPNPLHHVLRVAQLYKTLSDQETCSVLVARLSKMSNAHLEWAAEMVECLPGKVAKRSIWSPEKDSDEFMQGDSPIGIALELGDLKIVSHGAVFDVVKEAWPGKYTYEYNPFTGSIYNNLILEYRHSAGTKGSIEREFHFTWKKRFKEVANPKKLIRSPMMMYFVGIFLQTAFLVVFHVVVEQSSSSNDYDWSLGPASWYLILHVAGGILYEFGQLFGEGLLRYSKDPWNVVDVSMYSLLTIWFVIRVYEASADGNGKYVPEQSLSIDFLGIAGIFIWLRMLNVFGLDQNFGPLVKVIQGMVLNVTVFLVLLTVFLAGFATALRCIFKRAAGIDLEAVDHVKFDVESYRNQALSMLSLLDMSLGNFELVKLFSVSELAFCVTLTFLACTYIMLFNMLIAMMTDTYAKIRVESEQLWKKDRALLMASYTKTSKMLDKVNVAGTMTALPQPLNLLMVTIMLAVLPFYLPARWYWTKKNKRKAWQNVVNELQRVVIYILLFIFVTIPLSILFLVVVLPLNWIFVVSPGMLEYLGMDPFHWLPLWAFDRISQVVGILLTPLVFATAVLSVPVMRARKQLRRIRGFDSVYDTWEESSHHAGNGVGRSPRMLSNSRQSVAVAGASFGLLRPKSFFWERRESSPRQSSSGREFSGRSMVAVRRHSEEDPNLIQWDEDHGHANSQPTNDHCMEIWEEELDEDDKGALRAIHRSTMPLDNLDEGSAEAMMSKEELAMAELRAEIGRKIAAVDGTQRTLLQTTRDLQIESTLLQQHTSRALAGLEQRVKEVGQRLDAAGVTEDGHLESMTALQTEQLQLMREQAEQQSSAQLSAHKKLEEILSTLYEQYEPTTWHESGIEDGNDSRDIASPSTPPLTLPHRAFNDALSVTTNPSPVRMFEDSEGGEEGGMKVVSVPVRSPRGRADSGRSPRGREGAKVRVREDWARQESEELLRCEPRVPRPSRHSLLVDLPGTPPPPKPSPPPQLLPAFPLHSAVPLHSAGPEVLAPPSKEHARLRVPGKRGRTVVQVMEETLQAQQAESRRQLDLLHERIASLTPSVESLREQQGKQLEQLHQRLEQSGGRQSTELQAKELQAAMAALEERVTRRTEQSMQELLRRMQERSERERREAAALMQQSMQAAIAEGLQSVHHTLLASVRQEQAPCSGGDSVAEASSLGSRTRSCRQPQTPGPRFGPDLDREDIELLPYAHVQAALFAQAQTESNNAMSFRPWHERDANQLKASDVERCVAMYNTWRTFRGLPVPSIPDNDEVELRPYAYVRAGMYLVAVECGCPWHEVAVVEDARVPHVTREAIREALDMLAEAGVDAIGLDFPAFHLSWRQHMQTPTPPPPE